MQKYEDWYLTQKLPYKLQLFEEVVAIFGDKPLTITNNIFKS